MLSLRAVTCLSRTLARSSVLVRLLQGFSWSKKNSEWWNVSCSVCVGAQGVCTSCSLSATVLSRWQHQECCRYRACCLSDSEKTFGWHYINPNLILPITRSLECRGLLHPGTAYPRVCWQGRTGGDRPCVEHWWWHCPCLWAQEHPGRGDGGIFEWTQGTIHWVSWNLCNSQSLKVVTNVLSG